MQPERWNRLKTLFDEALARPAGDRPAFVDELGGEDASLKTALASLLAAHRDDGFLEEPAFRITSADEPLPAPARLGPYEIVREIGHGGMGTVYLALRADAEYEKQVAIKVVRGGLGSDELRRRFLTLLDEQARFITVDDLLHRIQRWLSHDLLSFRINSSAQRADSPMVIMAFFRGSSSSSSQRFSSCAT